ncbi:MAG: cobaltochelatase subunit CobN [Syntrophales bacterium]
MMMLVLFLIAVASVSAEPLKVSLLLGDTHTRAALEAIKEVKTELGKRSSLISPEQRNDNILLYAYPTQDILRRDLKNLRESKLVIIRGGDRRPQDRRLVEAVQPALEAVIKAGGKVYSVGGGYTANDQKMGILIDERINAYYRTRVVDNLKNMILYALKKDFDLDVPVGEPVEFPEVGIYERATQKIFTDFREFKNVLDRRNRLPGQNEKPWVGVLFFRTSLESGQVKPIDAVIQNLEARGFNVLPVFGYPIEAALKKIFLSSDAPKIRLLVGIGAKMSQNSEVVTPLLSRLQIPVINAIALSSLSEEQWRKSSAGLDTLERGWQIAGPEMIGIIQPTVIASKEKVVDKETGLEYTEYRPIVERIESLTARVKSWINLQDKPNRDKKVALIYYNYPPGKQTIGAAYLNVLPQSLYEMINRMRAEGYNVKGIGFGDAAPEAVKERLFNDIHGNARNIGNWAPGELDRMVKTGRPILIPLDIYKNWFSALPKGFRESVLKSWGPVERSNIMIWRGAPGKKFLVLPAALYGNVLLAPQPSRGWEQDENKLYHDVLLPPHHQYIAFYLWLKNEFRADAVVHIGTHGTHEWLPGKEVGFTAEDPPEVLIKDLPNIYPYNVDNLAEGIQAKRRGMAVIVDHMTPPFDKAGLNKEMKELASLLNDYRMARGKGSTLAAAKLADINFLARKTGVLKDLGIQEVADKDIESLDDYITDVSERQTPFGLHTFGKSPEERYRKSTVEAILSFEQSFSGAARERRRADLEERIRVSGQREMDSFMAALAGRYVPAGMGEDPIRNPDSLPTGKNFNSFDPSRIPGRSTYEMGSKLARDLIENYRQRHAAYPDKLTFNLWAEETMRNEGIMESQILYLMGIRPRWNERGALTGVEVVPRQELGRPRIDVTIVPSGLYRDVFSNLMVLLDSAVTIARNQVEEDNVIRTHVLKTKKMLTEKGIAEDKAERLASVRIFTEPSGTYGTNLSTVIPKSSTWDNEKQVADVYFMRMSHLFGQGFWGAKENRGQEDVSRDLLKNALSGSKIAVHSRSSSLYATLDNNDFFQYLGGTAMAIRAVDGKTPEVYVTDMTNSKTPKQETLEKAIGREMRSRYLNPEWIKAMMKEGYAGARFIDRVVEHLWGWQVTVPGAVDAAKWNEMYETYVLDRNGLDIKNLFRHAGNMHAYQSLVARMLETVRKDYWKPDREIVENLAKEYAVNASEVGLACCDHTCNNPLLTKFTASVLLSVPGLHAEASRFTKASEAIKSTLPQRREQPQKIRPSDFDQNPESAPDGSGKQVQGYEMQNVAATGASSAPIPYLFLLGFLIFTGLVLWGWRRFGR